MYSADGFPIVQGGSVPGPEPSAPSTSMRLGRKTPGSGGRLESREKEIKKSEGFAELQILQILVETKGFEPSTSRMRTERSPTRAGF